MARPLPSGKTSVNLARGEVRVSRIRRDPPPVVKEVYVDPEELDRKAVIIGILTVALALVVIILAVGSYNGWTPREYTVHI
jgi:hypothetical protein